MIRGKLKAGALQFVLFIGAVIAVLLLSFVLLNQTHQLFLKKTDRLIRVIEKADAAFQLALTADSDRQAQQLMEALPEPEIEVSVSQSSWGVFQRWEVRAEAGKQHFTRHALSGYSQPELPALYLADKARPGILVGKAKIEGDVYLPEQGLRPGSISGQSFYGSRLFKGRRFFSAENLPVVPEELLSGLETTLQPARTFRGQSSGERMLQNSFQNPPVLLTGDIVELSDAKLTGHILVSASKKIIVGPTAQLQDILLVAPEIEIQSGVAGSFQAIASRSISVGAGAILTYPSALVVLDNSPPAENLNQRFPPNISLGPKAQVHGLLMYLNKKEGKRYHPQIKLETGSLVRGQVYCEQQLELKGQVMGQVMTSGFIALERGGIYQNHILDGEILGGNLPANYAGLPFGPESFKAAVKWLY